MMQILCVVGARPNLMKIAPICQALEGHDRMGFRLLHTGQHYDRQMSHLFFEELGIPRPAVNLEVGGGTHAQQTAEVMKRFEPEVERYGPDLVLVVGDVNSTLACALVAVKLHVPVAHVEAGLRSGDRTMPEEINRILTDAISDLLFVTEQSGLDNLAREGIASERAHFVGNVMIDTLMRHREKAAGSDVLHRLGVSPREYVLLTLHRPSNVDDKETLNGILHALHEIQREVPLVLPIHPRTKKNLEAFGLSGWLEAWENLILTEPLGYLDFLCLMDRARVVLTDSGGIQEETTVCGVPCLTLRENTERPVTTKDGTNCLVGSDPSRILVAFRNLHGSDMPCPAHLPPLWDGRAAERIVRVLGKWCDQRPDLDVPQADIAGARLASLSRS